MPVESRPSDAFTKDNLLIGFSVVEFTPTGGSPVQLGILGGQELQKEVEFLQLQRGDAGTLTVDREIVSSLEVSFQLELFNFKADVAEYIFGSSAGSVISADAAATVTNEEVTLPGSTSSTDSERQFVDLLNGDVAESSFGGSAVTCAAITDEAVGTGDGTTGSTAGDFTLDFKPLAHDDVTSVTVGGVEYTVIAVGAAASGNEVEVTDFGDSTENAGRLQFFVGGVAANVTGAILATYTPSHSFANLTDYVVDPFLGRIRFLNVNGTADALRGGQIMNVDYTYNRRANVTLQPFTRTSVDGSCTIKHLTDIGVNFIWTIPSATIIITDEALTFGAEEFGTATLQLNVNDAGGSSRFGTLELSSETEAGA